DAAHRGAVLTPRRPGGDQEQVLGQRPRFHRFEHAVLEHELLGVGPVVRYLRGGVVAHDVGHAAVAAARRVVGDLAGRLRRVALPDEAVHPAAVDVGGGVLLAVRAAPVDVGGVVVGAAAPAGRVRYADRGHPMAHRDAVRPGVGAEVAIEGPVLLHDDDDVLDLVDAGRHH